MGTTQPTVDETSTPDADQNTARETRRATLLLVPAIGMLAFIGALAGRMALPDSSLLLRSLLVGAVTSLCAVIPFVTYSRNAIGRQMRLNDETQEHERQMIAEARRRSFETQLVNALEMSEGETEVLETVQHALAETLPDSPAEVLLADNSHAHLRRMVVRSDNGESPGCTVDSPENCPAARRAQVQRFADSDQLDACPKLRKRSRGRCSAVCVPVSIMGRTVGVIHATAAPDAVVADGTVQDLQTLANQAGARIGMLRIMAETQLQAATDSLTGLLNRRAFENKVHSLRAESTILSVAMADLDHFKTLNDTYGHETGDRALRMFAQTLASSLRSHDLVCRHGGEEFAIALPDCSVDNAAAALEKTRAMLAQAARAAGLPEFTVSVGIVGVDNADEDLASVVERADEALFEAKRLGRDRIVVSGGAHGPDLHELVPEPVDDAPVPAGRH